MREDRDEILAGLNPAQREAALAVRGPIAIVAGAGTGKTTTITRRIAWQVRSRTFAASSILAVTFTEKAASELRGRLRSLGVEGVEARTFHAAALSQLGRFWEPHTGQPLPAVLDSKAPLIASLAGSLPPPYKFLPRRELAGEIEWAKNRMIPAERYVEEVSAHEHEPPIPVHLMERIYLGYERRKRSTRMMDFEDMLSLAVRLVDEHPAAAEEVRSRYEAFTVDEYQDVNPLQAALLDRWLGGRDEVCVVGDDYQTIYAFTGASPSYLLSFPERHPAARVVRLEENYRSTPQVLSLANRLAPKLGGFRKRLRPTTASGPPPFVRALPDAVVEVDFAVEEVRRLHIEESLPFEEMAVLYRINARSEPFEEALADAGIPYQVRDGAFLRRPGPRAVLARLRDEEGSELVAAVERVTDAVGYDPDGEPESDDEATRQADLSRMRSLAEEFARAHHEVGASRFRRELEHRFSTERTGRGVNLLTYHRAKGLEFDAVFLPRLLDAELPFRSGRSKADPQEERRLLYVGITRARRHLYLTWPLDGRGPSPFLREIGIRPPAEARRSAKQSSAAATEDGGEGLGGPLFTRLRDWRRRRAAADGVPAYVVFHDSTLSAIAERKPRSRAELGEISGVGPTKLDRYAEDVIALVGAMTANTREA
jgi:DNA helicase II / ATP-dependent DNA helicase PcrA